VVVVEGTVVDDDAAMVVDVEDAHAPDQPAVEAMTPAAPSTAAARHGKREVSINGWDFVAEGETPAVHAVRGPTLASRPMRKNAA
jgi:hypothetical protein